MTRTGIVVFLGFAALILALSAYIVVVQRDLTALLFGVLIVLLLYVMLAVFLPRVSRPPTSRPP